MICETLAFWAVQRETAITARQERREIKDLKDYKHRARNNLNSSFPFRQAALKFCLPRASLRCLFLFSHLLAWALAYWASDDTFLEPRSSCKLFLPVNNNTSCKHGILALYNLQD